MTNSHSVGGQNSTMTMNKSQCVPFRVQNIKLNFPKFDGTNVL